MASGWEEVAATSQAALSVLGPGLALGAPPADSEVPGAHFRPPTLGPRTSEKAGQPRARVQHDPPRPQRGARPPGPAWERLWQAPGSLRGDPVRLSYSGRPSK